MHAEAWLYVSVVEKRMYVPVGNSNTKSSTGSWRQKVLSGSLFTNLGGIEASEKQAKKQRLVHAL
jgi:hypothetical protein